MTRVNFVRTCAAAAVACGLAVFAEATGYSQGQAGAGAAPAASQDRTTAAQQVTVVGCIQRETDYRKAQDAGRGGVAGTGLGAGNEYVLTGATMSTGSSAGSSAPSAAAAQPGSAAGATTGTAYELTGANEGQAAKHLGRRVEITGTLKAAEVGPAGNPTGGPTAGRPPSGVDVASKDLEIRELEVVSIREVGSTCPAM
jgi:hypothetical protein